jgi:hypothetical protein
MILPSSLASLSWNGTRVGPTAAVEQASPLQDCFPPSHEGGASPAFTARIERPPFYRGGSASKKDGWLLPHSPSDRARSGSKGSARVSFHPFHRARSASKEDGLVALQAHQGTIDQASLSA